MKERGIIFSALMVRAIFEGRKTQTRRIVTARWLKDRKTTMRMVGNDAVVHAENGDALGHIPCPYGVPGDRLWVRETHAAMCKSRGTRVAYRADMVIQNQTPSRSTKRTQTDLVPWPVDNAKGRGHAVTRWTPAIHMPRILSRLTLEVTAARVERLQNITEEDAIAEGISRVPFVPDDGFPVCDGYMAGKDDGRSALLPTARDAFERLWDTINGKRASWASNPWVWVVGFKVIGGAK